MATLAQRFLRKLAREGGHKTILLKLGCPESLRFPHTAQQCSEASKRARNL